MKKFLWKSLLAPTALAFTGILAVSCSGTQEVEEQFKRKILFNYFAEEGINGSKIFDLAKWEQINFSDEITTETIKSTIIENEKYNIEIREDSSNPNRWIVKNEDLKFVSFLYRYTEKNASETENQTNNKQWLAQTIYFNNSDDTTITKEAMSLNDYWTLAKESGDSNNLGISPYKHSFYDVSLFSPSVYQSMDQAGVNFITVPSYVAATKFDELNKKYNIMPKFAAGPNTNYNESSDQIWHTQLVARENSSVVELGKIQYLIDRIQIWKITKNENTYIKFKLPKNSIKVTLQGEEFWSNFDNEFYINISNWKK